MHTAGTTGDHAPWSGRGAFLEVGAAVRTLVARLVTRAGGRPAPLGRPSGPSAPGTSQVATAGDQSRGTTR